MHICTSLHTQHVKVFYFYLSHAGSLARGSTSTAFSTTRNRAVKTIENRPTRTTVTSKTEVRPSRTIPVKQNDTERKVLRPTRSNITQSGTVTKTKTQPAGKGIPVRKPVTAVKTKTEPKAAKSVKLTTTNPVKKIEAILKDAKIDEAENNTQATTTTRKTRKLASGKTKVCALMQILCKSDPSLPYRLNK